MLLDYLQIFKGRQVGDMILCEWDINEKVLILFIVTEWTRRRRFLPGSKIISNDPLVLVHTQKSFTSTSRQAWIY